MAQKSKPLISNQRLNPIQLELPFKGRGEAPRAERSEQARSMASEDERSGPEYLMEIGVEDETVKRALKRVVQNKGGPGIDGMRVEDLENHLLGHGSARSFSRVRTVLVQTIERHQQTSN